MKGTVVDNNILPSKKLRGKIHTKRNELGPWKWWSGVDGKFYV